MNRQTVLAPARNEDVRAFVKTPGMLRGSSICLSSAATVGDAVEGLLDRPIRTADDRRFAEHLRREIDSGPHNFFAFTHGNQLIEVERDTRLVDLAIPRELHFPDGPRQVKCVGIEVVQYASVGCEWSTCREQ